MPLPNTPKKGPGAAAPVVPPPSRGSQHANGEFQEEELPSVPDGGSARPHTGTTAGEQRPAPSPADAEEYAPPAEFTPDECPVPGPYKLPDRRVTILDTCEDGSGSMKHSQDSQGTFFPGLTRKAIQRYGKPALQRIFMAKYHVSGDVYYRRHLPLGQCQPMDYPKFRTTPVSKLLRAIPAEGTRFLTKEVFPDELDYSYEAVLVSDWKPTGPGETPEALDRAVAEFLEFVKTYGVKVTVVGDSPDNTNLELANRLNVTKGREVIFLDKADPEAVLNIVFGTLEREMEE